MLQHYITGHVAVMQCVTRCLDTYFTAAVQTPTCSEHYSHCWWSLWLLHCWLCSLALWSPEIYLFPDLHKDKPRMV